MPLLFESLSWLGGCRPSFSGSGIHKRPRQCVWRAWRNRRPLLIYTSISLLPCLEGGQVAAAFHAARGISRKGAQQQDDRWRMAIKSSGCCSKAIPGAESREVTRIVRNGEKALCQGTVQVTNLVRGRVPRGGTPGIMKHYAPPVVKHWRGVVEGEEVY